MSKLHHLSGLIFNQPLLICKDYLEVMLTAIADRLDITVEADPNLDRYHRDTRLVSVDESNGIAVMPIIGSMVQRGDMLNPSSGSTSYAAISKSLITLAKDEKVKGILLDMDTPGGQATGITAAADLIRKIDATKPVFALANAQATSGGYWLGSSARRFFGAPMASVGSIGVVTSHVDVSREMDKRGRAVTFVTAGARKVEGHPYAPLDETARASLQARVNEIYDQFVSAVAVNRNLAEADVRGTEAGVFGPAEAVRLGLIDSADVHLSEAIDALSHHAKARTVFGFTPTTGEPAVTDKLLYSEADLAKARAEGVAEGVIEGQKDLASKTNAAVISALEVALSLTDKNPRLEALIEGVRDNVPLATAAKFATKIAVASAPTTPSIDADLAKQVRDLIESTAPKVNAGEDQGVADAKTTTGLTPERQQQIKNAALRASTLPFVKG